MRFKAELTNGKVLLDLLQSLSHVGRYLLLQLNSSNIIACIDKSAIDSISGNNQSNNQVQISNEQCFIELKHESIFTNYRIESKNANNAICCIFNIQNAIQAIRMYKYMYIYINMYLFNKSQNLHPINKYVSINKYRKC